MQTDTLYIKGSDLSLLVDLFKNRVNISGYYSYDNVFVFALEKYFFRVESNLLTIVIFNVKDKEKTDIRIISGGGGEGILGITWGSEARSNKLLIGILKKLCESYGWRLYDAADDEVTEYADPDAQKQLENESEEYQKMVVKYNELLDSGKEQDADKLYDEWCKQHPDEEEKRLYQIN